MAWSEWTSIAHQDLAQKVFDDNRNANTGDLLKEWMQLGKFQLNTYFKKYPEEAFPAVPMIRGFFGEVSLAGSSWSIGEVAMNTERTMWKEAKKIDQKSHDGFVDSGGGGRDDLMQQFFSNGEIKRSGSADADAMTMHPYHR